MRRKALKQKKKLESSPFWNPESTELKSGIQQLESGIHSVESRIQDCHGFPYMGRHLSTLKILRQIMGLWEWSRPPRFKPKKKSNRSIQVLHPIILSRTSGSNRSDKQTSHSSIRTAQFSRIRPKQLALTVHLLGSEKSNNSTRTFPMSIGALENKSLQKSGRAIALPAPPPPRSLLSSSYRTLLLQK